MFWPIIIGNVLAYLWCAYQVLGATYYMASMAWLNQDPPATDVILHVNVPCAGGSPAYLEIDKLPDGIYRASVGTLFEHQEVCRTRDPGGAGAARQHDGRPRKLTLGSYPAIGLATARDLAREALERVARGEDPAATKGKVGGKSFHGRRRLHRALREGPPENVARDRAHASRRSRLVLGRPPARGDHTR